MHLIAQPANRQNAPMARRRRDRRSERRRSGEDDRIPGLGSHWRSDGVAKTGYRSQSDALVAADMRRQESGVDLNVYRCDVCSAWHMGKPNGRDG